MLSASRHPSTTAVPVSASEEYCTAALPVMTPELSARDSQDTNRARISTAPALKTKPVSSEVSVSFPSMEIVPDWTVHS